jgi:hypothetical protein
MKKLALLLLVAVLLAACQPAATPQPTPAPVEALAGSIDDLVGVWGGPHDSAQKLEFKADGTIQMFYGSGNQRDIIVEGSYTFDSGKITFPAPPVAPCKDQPATYQAYITKLVGERISLRMQVVGSDPCVDRANSLSSPFQFNNP